MDKIRFRFTKRVNRRGALELIDVPPPPTRNTHTDGILAIVWSAIAGARHQLPIPPVAYFPQNTCFKTIEIEHKTVLDLIRDQIDYLFSLGERPEVVIIGSAVHIELAGELHDRLEYMTDLRYADKIYGVAIKIVPWIDGCVVLPRSVLRTGERWQSVKK